MLGKGGVGVELGGEAGDIVEVPDVGVVGGEVLADGGFEAFLEEADLLSTSVEVGVEGGANGEESLAIVLDGGGLATTLKGLMSKILEVDSLKGALEEGGKVLPRGGRKVGVGLVEVEGGVVEAGGGDVDFVLIIGDVLQGKPGFHAGDPTLQDNGDVGFLAGELGHVVEGNSRAFGGGERG